MEYGKLAESIVASPIRAMMVKAAHMEDVVSFGVGEPDFITDGCILKETAEHLSSCTKYAPGAGIDPLRERYIRYLNEMIGSDYSMPETMVTSGGMAALYLAFFCLLNPGDEVLIPAPYFSNYGPMVAMCRGTVREIEVKEENDFILSVEDLRAAVTEKSRILLLNSPCNPTGGLIDRESLQKIAEFAKEKDLFVFSDEVYRHLNFDSDEIFSIATLPGMKERTLIIDSVSKSFAMTGFRVGFATGPVHLIELMTKCVENVYSAVATPSQYAALVAFDKGMEAMMAMKKEYKKRRDFLVSRINEMDKISCIMPKGAFYVFANIKKTGLSAEEFAERLLEKEHVAVIPGSNFSKNASGYVRISYGTSMEKIEDGLNRMERFLKSL